MKFLFFIFAIFSSFGLYSEGTSFGSVMKPLETNAFLEVIDGHINALREGNVAKAYHLYTSGEFKQHTSFEEFESIVKSFSPLYENDSIELFTINYLEEHAYYLGRICSKIDALMIEYEMVNEKGLWKINSFNLRNIVSNKK